MQFTRIRLSSEYYNENISCLQLLQRNDGKGNCLRDLKKTRFRIWVKPIEIFALSVNYERPGVISTRPKCPKNIFLLTLDRAAFQRENGKCVFHPFQI